ncbi:GNAT family N-acetyltransferase [Parapedomonas caeni]
MFIRTDRLLLRPLWPEDAPAVARGAGDRAVAWMLARVPHPYTLHDAAVFIDGLQGAPEPVFAMLTHDLPEVPLVGVIGLHRGDGGYELGYWLARAAWGCGYATEAGRAVLDLAFEGLRLPRVVADHFHDNPASGRVLAKLGFRPVGMAPRHSLARGGLVDSRTVALTRPQWRAHRAGQMEMKAA